MRKFKQYINGPFISRMKTSHGPFFLRVGLLLLLSVASFALSQIFAESSPRPSPRVVAILSKEIKVYNLALKGFMSICSYPVEVMNIQNSPDELSKVRDTIQKDPPDLVFTIGIPATGIKQDVKNIPIVYSVVQSPWKHGLRGIPNICGVAMDISARKYISTLKEVFPKARDMGVVYNPKHSEYTIGELEYLEERMKVRFHKKPIDSDKDLKKALSSLAGKIDSFWMIGDPTIASPKSFEIIKKFCRKNKVALFTSFVTDESLFSIPPNYTHMGMQAGEIANEIINKKKNPEDYFVQFPKVIGLHVNNNVADQINITIPAPIRRRDEITRHYEAAIDFFNEAKWAKAKPLLMKILSWDPQNEGARFHLNKVEQELKKIRMQEEKEKIEAEFYVIQKTIQKGNKLDGIKKLISLLKDHPKFEKAKKQLARTRKELSPRMEEWFREGVQLSASRDFKGSINSFKKILLVDPGHRQARQYLERDSEKLKTLNKLQQGK